MDSGSLGDPSLAFRAPLAGWVLWAGRHCVACGWLREGRAARGDGYVVLVGAARGLAPKLLGQNQVTVPGEASWFGGDADGDVGSAGRTSPAVSEPSAENEQPSAAHPRRQHQQAGGNANPPSQQSCVIS